MRLVVLSFATAVLLTAQKPVEAPRTAYRSDSRMVLVPVTVTDQRGAAVNGLPASVFSVLEDKAQQPIVSFGEEDVPCSIGIVFDLSQSMRAKLPQARHALKSFFDLAEPEDEAMLVTVSSHPTYRFEFTRDFDTILDSLRYEPGRGNTALFDAVYLTLSSVRKSQNRRRALLVFSDGVDNNSRYTSRELLRLADEAGVEIHTIAVFDPGLHKKPIEAREDSVGAMFMEQLANRTGGLHFVVRSEKDMREAAAKIGRALRSRYVIGYRPAAERDGQWHQFRVRLKVPDTVVHARERYLSE